MIDKHKRNSGAGALLIFSVTGLFVWFALATLTPEPRKAAKASKHDASALIPGAAEQTQDEPELSSDGADSTSSPGVVSWNLEPLDVIRYRQARGYYMSGNDIGAKHAYEYMDLESLEELANQEDGLAQLVLAHRLEVSNYQKSVAFYKKAAINGKTAALVNLASSQLVVRAGGGFGFDIADERGQISERYADVLQYYAAAELLGDFVGTELLQQHLQAADFFDDDEALVKVCRKGQVIASHIRRARLAKWGVSEIESHQIESIDIPVPVCQTIGEQ